MTQTLGGGDPEVVSLKVHPENVVVRGGGLYREVLHLAGGIAHQHFRLVRAERRTVHRPVLAVVVGQTLVGGEPGAIGIYSLDLVEKVAGQAAVFLQEVVPVAAVVAAGSEVSRNPQDFVYIADRCGDLVNQALIFHDYEFSLAVGIVVILPVLGLNVVFEDAASPDCVIDFVVSGANGVRPDLEHGRIAFVEQSPFAGASVQAAGAGSGCGPDEVALHTDSVDHVVAQAGVQLCEGVDASGRDAAQPTHGAGPDVAGVLVSRQGEHGPMCQTVSRAKYLPRTLFVQAQPVLRAGPDAVPIHEHAEDVVVGQAIGGGEVLPAKPRHVLSGQGCREKQGQRGQPHIVSRPDCQDRMNRRASLDRTAEGGCPNIKDSRLHNVFRYSIKSFNSSLVRSLVTPCVSLGLNTVQISSRERAEPSCR